MLSCSSKQVGQGEMLSQIDFCLPENRVDLVLSVGALNIRVSVSFGGSFSFKQWSQRSVGEARATPAGLLTLPDRLSLSRRSSRPPRPAARLCPRLQAAVGPVAGPAGQPRPAPPGRAASESSAVFLVSLIHFSCFLCFRLLVILSIVARLSLNNPSPLTPPPTSKDVLLVVRS